MQTHSKIDPDADTFREVVETAMALLPEKVLDEPIGDPPEYAFGSHALET